jgi:hypothetical protein
MNDARAKTGLDLSLVQVVAGTGAALTAALLGSLFGIAGTLTGTAVGSTVATVCTALYTHQLRRTRDRLQGSARFPLAWLRPASWRTLPWRPVLTAAVVVFGVALTALTVLEASLGRPLSSATAGSPRGRRESTSLGRALAAPVQQHRSVPRGGDRVSPAVPVRGSASPTALPGSGAPAPPGTRPNASAPPANQQPWKPGPAGVEPGGVGSAGPSDPADSQPSPPRASDSPAAEPTSPLSVDPSRTETGQPAPPPSEVQP